MLRGVITSASRHPRKRDRKPRDANRNDIAYEQPGSAAMRVGIDPRTYHEESPLGLRWFILTPGVLPLMRKG